MIYEKKERFVLTNVIETELDILKRHVKILKVLKEMNPLELLNSLK